MSNEEALSTLGLAPGATETEIKDAYRDLASVWHPDRFNHDERLQRKAEECFKTFNQAYQQLKFLYKPVFTLPTRPARSWYVRWGLDFYVQGALDRMFRRSRSSIDSATTIWFKVWLSRSARRFIGLTACVLILFAVPGKRRWYEEIKSHIPTRDQLFAWEKPSNAENNGVERNQMHLLPPIVISTRSAAVPLPSSQRPVPMVVQPPVAARAPLSEPAAQLLQPLILRPSQWSLSDLSVEETKSLESSCTKEKYVDGPAAYESCQRRKLRELGTATMPDLSHLNAGQTESLRAVCATYKYVDGPARYIKCLNKQLSLLARATPYRPQ